MSKFPSGCEVPPPSAGKAHRTAVSYVPFQAHFGRADRKETGIEVEYRLQWSIGDGDGFSGGDCFVPVRGVAAEVSRVAKRSE